MLLENPEKYGLGESCFAAQPTSDKKHSNELFVANCTTIRDTVRMAEAPYYRESIITYDNTGTGSEDYRALAIEFERRARR